VTEQELQYTVLSGGVGGAKLVLGLRDVLAPDQLQVITNTGDDFVHLDLPICPDLDTLMYTLAGTVNPATGWGLADETWEFMDSVRASGGPDWFQLGDKDIATHTQRRSMQRQGMSLSGITAALCRNVGVATRIWPMSDDIVKTHIETASQRLEFQDYFVRLKATPVATGFSYVGSDTARASPGALAALRQEKLGAIIIAPSNPWLSIDPILAVGDIKAAIQSSPTPVIAVSPIVGGRAIKGPTAKLMTELGMEVSALAIARHYQAIIDGLIIDQADADQTPAIEALGLRVGISNTVMNSLKDKQQLARFLLDFARDVKPGIAP
jgi:LPPG:FO 2-phospho-L-lactate transferase